MLWEVSNIEHSDVSCMVVFSRMCRQSLARLPNAPAAQKATPRRPAFEKNEMIRALHEEHEYADPLIALRACAKHPGRVGIHQLQREIDANDSRLSVVLHD